MTTLAFNHHAAYFPNVRAPRVTFAARLAALQARQDIAPGVTDALGVVARFAVALVPFTTLAWIFIAI